MRYMLTAGESLNEGDYLESPDLRFQLHLLRTGKGTSQKIALILYAFSKSGRRVLWNSTSRSFDERDRNFLEMGKDGALRLYNGMRRLEMYPDLVLGKRRCGKAGAFMYLTNDGRWKILEPDLKHCTSRPSAKPNIDETIIPNAPTVHVPPGSLALPATTTIENDTKSVMGVTDTVNFKTLFPGESAQIGSPESLAISIDRVGFNPQGGPSDGVGLPAIFFPRGTKTIKISSIRGIGLVL